ncbi:MAG: hypothetical protein E6I32_02455 [Chloroflexi bacterium]|nr:MAG: hypothetical protein E6I32_02455 [Chloroflexota bacterium]
MAIKYVPEVEQHDAPPLKTSPRRSGGGWFRRLQRRVKLALAGNDDELRVENKTAISWRVYHNYHQLGIIDAHEQRVFRMDKHGSLSVRPCADGDDVEYLVLDLSLRIHRVHIYRRRVSQDIDIYDMRVA